MKQTFNEAERNLASYEHLDPPEYSHEYYCERCEKIICIGERKWDINGSYLCDDCAKDMFSEIVEE